MALNKSKTLANGASGNYWRIMSAVLDKQQLKVTYTIALCVDAAHKNSPIGAFKTYVLSITTDQAKGDLVAQGYDFIKTKAASSVPNLTGSGTHIYDPDLAGATDA